MPFEYEPPATAELRQGEIVGPIVELRAAHPAIEIAEGVVPAVDSIKHRMMVIITADCDLLRDFIERERPQRERGLPNLLNHILLIDMYSETEIAGAWPSGFGHRERRHALRNQNERFHCFPKAKIRGSASEVEALHMDFKNVLGTPPQALYQGLASGQIIRHALIPPLFLQDLTHRLYGFLSRVGPDYE